MRLSVVLYQSAVMGGYPPGEDSDRGLRRICPTAASEAWPAVVHALLTHRAASAMPAWKLRLYLREGDGGMSIITAVRISSV